MNELCCVRSRKKKKKKKRRTEDVNASCEEAMEGMMHWQTAKTNG
jgi:hypothetical protein